MVIGLVHVHVIDHVNGHGTGDSMFIARLVAKLSHGDRQVRHRTIADGMREVVKKILAEWLRSGGGHIRCTSKGHTVAY